ncbi:hypothetical protein M3O96_14455 [Aquiflexum sp. TKW24L]|uniref:hypothetical protein n=1 Tax=Aquiflexum sp. TKW24L TaxID=2942212 RepID=UPI0020C121C0|nr:hypothetical protein [Aquiflexum sp. TKW24L]MCL6260300.1 hypothetical protein [Aquiflexum sp. TKW24L]
MKRLFTYFILLNFISFYSHAQITTVNYDIVSNEINGNTPLPSEDVFFIKGVLPKNIELVQVGVKRGSRSSNIQEVYFWKKPFDFEISQFELFVSEPLRANERYTLEFQFFSRAKSAQIEEVQNAINKNLESYIRANLEVTSGGIKVNHSNQVMMTQMDKIVADALEDYRNYLGRDFKGFSEIFRQKLEQKDRLKLRRARFNILGKNKGDNDKAVYASQYIEELIALAQNESNQFVGNNLLSLVEISLIDKYPTEKKPTTLPLNFGYATIPFKRSLSDTEYLHGFYAGVSLPLGNRTFTKFLGNTSFSTGVFLQNFETQGGDKISGQYIGLPIYAGLGYKFFRIMRFNVGAVLVNQEELNTGISHDYVQFFTGISLELNLWMGLNNKR